MAMEIGCRKIRLSYSPNRAILTKAINVTNTSMGSVGMDKPEPPVRSVSVMDTGVAKTMNHMAQSSRYRVSQTTRSAGGNKNTYHCSNTTANAINGSKAEAISANDLLLISTRPSTYSAALRNSTNVLCTINTNAIRMKVANPIAKINTLRFG